uniref:Myotubularin phosphatase domain-containing protein n=1 Tax=Aureoumbra lagunensis TaxID=44058 RepID=A0A7S3K6I6_9STRA
MNDALENQAIVNESPEININGGEDEDDDDLPDDDPKDALEAAALSVDNTSSGASERKHLTEKFAAPPTTPQQFEALIVASGANRNQRLIETNELILDDAVAIRHATPAIPGRVLVSQAQLKFEPYPSNPKNGGANEIETTVSSKVFAAARIVSGFALPLDALLFEKDDDQVENDSNDGILSIMTREGSLFRLCLKFARSSLCSSGSAKKHKSPANVLISVLSDLSQKRKALCVVSPSSSADSGMLIPRVISSRRSNTVFGDCSSAEQRVASDYIRLGVDESNFWQRTIANANYALCPTYPSLLFAPLGISDKDLEDAASFRSKRRLMALSWRDKELVDEELVILRCAQPLAGVQQKTNVNDERMLRLVARGKLLQQNHTAKLHVFDARPYVNVAANALAGKGVEAIKSYAKDNVKVELSFLNIENIHVVRSSYCHLRKAIDASASLGWVGNRGVGSSKENLQDDLEENNLFGFYEEAARVALRAGHGKRQRLGQRFGKTAKKKLA